MKRGLFLPTGNVECDLLSFASNKQFSATSPELSALENNRAASSVARYRSANCAKRPLTALSYHQNRARKARESRCQSAHEPLREDSVTPVEENLSVDNCTGMIRHRLHCSKSDRIESVPPSIQEVQRQLHTSKTLSIVPKSPKENQSKEDDADAKLGAKLQQNLDFKGSSPANTRMHFCEDRSSDQHDHDVGARKNPKARQRLRNDRTKNSKKVKWKNAIIPLPTGSDFDNLIRSGVIAKHIAKRERKQRR